MRKFFIIICVLVLAGCADMLRPSRVSPLVPEDWTYVQVPTTSLELPMPQQHNISRYNNGYLFESRQSEKNFHLLIHKVPNVSSLNDYLLKQCHTLDGQMSVPPSNGFEDFPLKYETTDEFVINAVNVVELSNNCRYYTFVLTHLLILESEIYEVGLLDAGLEYDREMFDRVIYNIRPIQTSK